MKLKQGDTYPPIREELALKTEADLEAATVYFRMEANDGSVLIDSEATVDVETGEASYEFVEGDTNRVGTHRAEWVVEWPDERETHPSSGYLEVEILRPLPRDDE